MPLPACVVHTDPIDVNARLSQMGLSSELLWDAILEGHIARESCAATVPPMYAGITGWAITTSGLRDRLIPSGWTPSDAGNYSIITAPDGQMAIVVATGDDATAGPGDPRTKSPKGPATAEAVGYNVIQVELWPEVVAAVRERERQSGTQRAITWILLIGRSGMDILAELSLPSRIGDDNRVMGWSERIVLGSRPDDGGTLPLPLPESGPDFDVDVVRRAI
jgi:hypothetical protein